VRRTTITLPEHLATLVEREARRRQLSLSAVVRQALEAHFGVGNGQPRRLPVANLGRSGQPDVAERIEEILAEEWNPRRNR
jgi:hypothetical protein